MKKRHLLVIALCVVVISLVIAVPAGACVQGCTPGYWKQEHHFDSWVGYSPEDLFSDVFGVGPDITLLDALWAKGGGENAFLRHAVAALLSAAHEDVAHTHVWIVINEVQAAYGSGAFEYYKNRFEGWNEMGCPLD